MRGALGGKDLDVRLSSIVRVSIVDVLWSCRCGICFVGRGVGSCSLAARKTCQIAKLYECSVAELPMKTASAEPGQPALVSGSSSSAAAWDKLFHQGPQLYPTSKPRGSDLHVTG